MATRTFPDAFLLRLPEGMRSRLDKAAQALGQTRAEYVRQALRRALAEKPRR